jgi:hypothetical protein
MRLLPVTIPMEISRTPRGTLSIPGIPLNPHPQSILEICLNFPYRFANLNRHSAAADWDEAMHGGERLAWSRHRNTVGGDAGCFANKWIHGLPLAA